MNYSVPYQQVYPQSPQLQAAAVPQQVASPPLPGVGAAQLPGYAPAFAGGPTQPSGPGYAQPVAPVSPVPGPGPAYAAPQGDAVQQNPQQAYARHMVGVARALEQTIPGYQFLISALQDLQKESSADRQPAAQRLVENLKEAVFQHFAALGAIRRLLIGEVTPDILLNLSLALNRLLRIHNGMRPLLDQVASSPSGGTQSVAGSLGAGAQSVIGSLAAHLQATEAQLNQAAAAVQAAVPPQVWESARRQAFAPGKSA